MSDVSELKTKPFRESRSQIDLFSGLMRARKQFGGSKTAIVDGDERALTYTEIVRAAFALGSALKKGTKPGEAVGIMLPTGVGAVIAFYAVLAFGRVPAMINFTAGSRNIKSAMRAGQISRIITAHKFVELGALEPLIEQLTEDVNFVYLELSLIHI